MLIQIKNVHLYINLVLILKNSFKDKMAQSEGFYMTLPSDGSQSFPNNKLSSFKTLLPSTINLTDGEWEMGLTELIFDHSVQNISPEEAHFDVAYERQGWRNMYRILILLNLGASLLKK